MLVTALTTIPRRYFGHGLKNLIYKYIKGYMTELLLFLIVVGAEYMCHPCAGRSCMEMVL